MLQDYAEDFNTQESALKVSSQQPLLSLVFCHVFRLFDFLSDIWVADPGMLLADGEAQSLWQV